MSLFYRMKFAKKKTHYIYMYLTLFDIKQHNMTKKTERDTF